MSLLSPHGVDMVGYLSAALTTPAFDPQLQKIVWQSGERELGQ